MTPPLPSRARLIPSLPRIAAVHASRLLSSSSPFPLPPLPLPFILSPHLHPLSLLSSLSPSRLSASLFEDWTRRRLPYVARPFPFFSSKRSKCLGAIVTFRRIAQDHSFSPVMDNFRAICVAPCRYVVFCLFICYVSGSLSHAPICSILPSFCQVTMRFRLCFWTLVWTNCIVL
jgi:hypothetical protein